MAASRTRFREQEDAPASHLFLANVIQHRLKILHAKKGSYHYYLSGAVCDEAVCGLGLLYEGLHLVARVVAGVVVSADHRLDDLALVSHLRQHLALLGLHARGLHGSEDLRLLALRDAAEANRCK